MTQTNSKPEAKAKPAAKAQRRTQGRTEITRAKLLEAATVLFSEQGYDGISVRDIENSAGVQRGLLAYHFESKETLWKAVADITFGLMQEEISPRLAMLKDLPARERIAFIVRFYVRFSAEHPELSRLMSLEGRQDSWRIHYLVNQHVRPTADAMKAPVSEILGLDDRAFVHWYYMMVGAASTIFSHAPECHALFGVDSHGQDIVDTHADLLVTMLLGPAKP